MSDGLEWATSLGFVPQGLQRQRRLPLPRSEDPVVLNQLRENLLGGSASHPEKPRCYRSPVCVIYGFILR